MTFPTLPGLTHMIIVISAVKRGGLHSFLLNHPLLDPLGGGDLTFTHGLALEGDPDDGSIIRNYVCGWWMTPEQWEEFRTEVVDRQGFRVNTTSPANDLSWYDSQLYSYQAVLKDEDRKPFELKVVPVEV